MAVTSLVIEVDATDASTAQQVINDALTNTTISTGQFIQAVSISLQNVNQTAYIVIFYDDGT